MQKVKSPFTVLRITAGFFRSENKQIFYPFIITVFINLLLLEILYFYPRYPLALFFSPIISRIWGDEYLHYPMNLILLPKLFYYSQIVIFLFVSNILSAMTVDMVADINNDKTVNFRASLRRSLPGYIYIVLYSTLSLLLFKAFDSAYALVIRRTLEIHSTTGIFFWIKKSVFYAAPYAQFPYSILILALILYVPVLIILEKKKFLGALIGNFKTLFGSFWVTLTLVLIPTLFYLPLLLMQSNIRSLIEVTAPEIQILIIVLGIFVITGINIFVMAAATTYYLYKKESS